MFSCLLLDVRVFIGKQKETKKAICCFCLVDCTISVKLLFYENILFQSRGFLRVMGCFCFGGLRMWFVLLGLLPFSNQYWRNKNGL